MSPHELRTLELSVDASQLGGRHRERGPDDRKWGHEALGAGAGGGSGPALLPSEEP